jgi:phosphoglycerol transferase MdoB-like AlkP superfamily enzyme
MGVFRDKMGVFRGVGLTGAKLLGLIAASCALAATTHFPFLLHYATSVVDVYSFPFFVLLWSILLSFRLIWLSVPLALICLKILSAANELKISLVSFPVTYLDVTTSMTDPKSLLNALGVNPNAYILAMAALLAGSAGLLSFYMFRKHSSLGGGRSWLRGGVLHVLAICIVAFWAQYSLMRYGEYWIATAQQDPKLWQSAWPTGQPDLSRKIGVLEYIAFSSSAGNEHVAASPKEANAPSEYEIESAASRFVNISSAPKLLPNIVMMHLESTFDPNVAFRLAKPVELPLWSRLPETRALGLLHVNIIGGGSWVTEFEVITGVDSRVFGYQGFYTHYYIAPEVKYSLPRYLSKKGYVTKVFYTVAGAFYNADKAFKFYGFDDFIDGKALKLAFNWNEIRDTDLVKRIDEQKAFENAGPFFYYIVTLENHGPHPCVNFTDVSNFLTTFAGEVGFKANCQLNEYLKRAGSTSAAFLFVLEKLKAIEALTGRPYVLLGYGDHQPWDFTSGIYSVAGGTALEEGYNSLSSVRTSADPKLTVFHLLASDQAVIRKQFSVPPPATLLPTLLSAFVASSYEDLYLPLNFFAYQSCGTDLLLDCVQYENIAGSLRSALTTPTP